MDTRAEKALIGALVTDNQQWKKVKKVIRPEMFYDALNRLLFTTIGNEVEAGHQVDAVILAETCSSDDVPKEMVINRLTDALTTAETSALAPRYAREARKQWAVWKYNNLANGGLDVATTQTIGERAETLKAIAESLMDVEEESDRGKTLAEVARQYKGDYFCDKAKAPYDTGFPLLDETVQLAPGDVTIIAARPSVGKSALVTQIAKHIADSGKKVGFFSLEMSQKQCYERFVVAISGIGLTRLKKAVAYTNDEEERFRKANDVLEKSETLRLYEESYTVDGMKAECESRGFDVVIVDYLQLVSSSDRYKGNRVQEVTEISRGLKQMASDLRCHVIALSQFNRAAANDDNGEPTSDQLRESGALEQDASNIWLLWNSDKDDNKKKILKVDKNRQGPRFVKIELSFNGDSMKFEEVGIVEGKKVVRESPKSRRDFKTKDTDNGPFMDGDAAPFQVGMPEDFLWR